MRYRRALVAVCAAMLCVIATAGCGGDAAGQFKASYALARAPLKRTFADVVSATDPSGRSMGQVAHRLEALADRFGRELGPIKALKPPAAAAAAFVTLTTSLERVEGDLRATYVAVDHRDPVGAQQAIASLQSDARAASDAEAAVTQELDHK